MSPIICKIYDVAVRREAPKLSIHDTKTYLAHLIHGRGRVVLNQERRVVLHAERLEGELAAVLEHHRLAVQVVLELEIVEVGAYPGRVLPERVRERPGLEDLDRLLLGGRLVEEVEREGLVVWAEVVLLLLWRTALGCRVGEESLIDV